MFFQLVDARDDFIVDELPGRFGDHAMLFAEVFGSEDVVRRGVRNHELTA
jgi:hypothetical protein